MVFDTEFVNEKSAILGQGMTVVTFLALGMVGNGILRVCLLAGPPFADTYQHVGYKPHVPRFFFYLSMEFSYTDRV